MFNRHTLIAAAALILLAGLWLLHGSDEDAILAQLEQLREQAVVAGPESGLEQLARANSIADLFSEATVYDLTRAGYGTTRIATRQELVRRIITLRSRLATLEIEIRRAEVRIDGDTAEVQLTASGLGALTGQQGEFLEIHSGIVTLARQDSDWLITGATHIRDERQPSQ
jgi:hypothetical protein